MNRFIVPALVVVAAVTGTATLALAITERPDAATAQPRSSGGPIGTVAGSQPGQRVRISAKFPAPPAGVGEVSVQARGFPSFDRVSLGR